MPPEPRLDLPFLIVSFGAIFFNILFIVYYTKARKYKKQLDDYLNNKSTSFINPNSSSPETTTTPNQLRKNGS